MLIIGTFLFTSLLMVLSIVFFAKTKSWKKFYKNALVSLLVLGLVLYSYIYAIIEPNFILAGLRAVWSVLKMFTGTAEYDMALKTPLFQSAVMRVVFWILHFAAFYFAVGTVVKLIGDTLLKRIRIWLKRNRELVIIYGLSNNSVRLGKNLLEENALAFVDEKASPLEIEKIKSLDVLYETDYITRANRKTVFKHLGVTKNRPAITVYAISNSENNTQFALNSVEAMKEIGIPEERIHLVLFGNEKSIADNLESSYASFLDLGSFSVTEEVSLIGRTLIQTYPPYKALRCKSMPEWNFDESGKAEENFHAVIVGFGHIGQEVFKRVFINGQFVDSCFQADIYDPTANNKSGLIRTQCKALFETFSNNIRFHEYDARSEAFYNDILARIESVNYIVVCTDDERRDLEIGNNLIELFSDHGIPINVYLAGKYGVKKASHMSGEREEPRDIYSPEILSCKKLDQGAKVLNGKYSNYLNVDLTKDILSEEFLEFCESEWYKLGYFNRMSNRASADFAEAFLAASHTKITDDKLKVLWKKDENGTWVMSSQWVDELKSNDELLSVLGEMEHKRWCAFHYVMGWSEMKHEEIKDRGLSFVADVQAGKKPERIDKNTTDKRHGCLIPWENLPQLDDIVNYYFGQANAIKSSRDENESLFPLINYRAVDKMFVELVPFVIEAQTGIKHKEESANKV